ncbi:MAG: sodium:proton antiporter [Deltaproteobacteria bacterium]|nr:sodium:proton antiporter [Deltaproteobacteria bacterium]
MAADPSQPEGPPLHTELVVVLLFAVASIVALIAKRFRLPYTVALVVAGLALGTVDVVDPPHLTQTLLYSVFLPGLLFEAAFHLEFKTFWANKLTIHALAVPGVVASILLTAAVFTPVASALELESGFRFVDGLVFAAILAATDPIAVVSVFKSLGVPKRLAVLIEGESLLNDGTAVVLVGIILALALGGSLSVPAATLQFAFMVGVGGLIGGGIGYAVSLVIQRVDDPMIEITLTTIAAWGSFMIAEQTHASGVIATVAAGMVCGNYGKRTGMSPSTIVATETFWEYVAFALNSLVFLLIGFEVQIDDILANWAPILVAWGAVTGARAVVVFGVAGLLRKSSERIPWSWSAVLSWGGLRGSLSMVLVLSLAPDFPHRAFLVTVTFGVVLVSILLQGLSIGPLLKRLRVVGAREDRLELERARARLAAATAARQEIDHLTASHGVPVSVVAELRAEYDRRHADADAQARLAHVEREAVMDEERHRARRHLLMLERSRVRDLLHEGLLSEEAAAPVLADIDARVRALEDPPAPPPTAVEAPSA